MSVSGFGEIAQGANDINQCISIILATQKGSDPLRPDFGVDLLSWQDKPTPDMAAGLAKEIIEQIGEYEPRINLSNINYMYPDERVVFAITWTYVDSSAAQGFTVNKTAVNNYTSYFLLTNESGFVLLDDNGAALILN